MGLLLLACDGDVDRPVDRESPPQHSEETGGDDSGEAPLLWESSGGFGFALASDGDTVAASAPWEQAVRSLEGEELASGELGFGYAMAWGEELVVGNPLDGDQGAVVRHDGVWMLSEGAGARFDGELVELPVRPADLARWGDRRVAGLARGEHALWLDGELVERPEAGDQAGYSLCVADVDRDGVEELVVGAPAADAVHVLDEDFEEALTLAGEGRFGHALACAEGLLAVGAPLADEVVVYEDLEELERHEGPAELGASLLFVAEALYAGAPGSSSVLRLR